MLNVIQHHKQQEWRILASTPATPIWFVLLAATCYSWWLGVGHYHSTHLLTITVMSIAFGKAALIGYFFMELREAPPILRTIFTVWVMVIWTATLSVYLFY